jgi:hypothetical protein
VLVVHVVREVHVDCVGAGVRVFGRIDACEVLVIDKDRVVGRG